MAGGLSSLQYFCSGRNILSNPYITADDCIVAYCDTAQDGAIAVYDDIVFEDRMAVDTLDGVTLCIKGETLGSEGNALVEFHMVAKDTGGTDDDACAMVDGEVATDGGGGMYVNTSFAMSHFGDDARYERYA